MGHFARIHTCPHCGEDLCEVGVIELRGYIEYPNEQGIITGNTRCANQLDDTEGFRCGACSGELDFEDDLTHDDIALLTWSEAPWGTIM